MRHFNQIEYLSLTQSEIDFTFQWFNEKLKPFLGRAYVPYLFQDIEIYLEYCRKLLFQLE